MTSVKPIKYPKKNVSTNPIYISVIILKVLVCSKKKSCIFFLFHFEGRFFFPPTFFFFVASYSSCCHCGILKFRYFFIVLFIQTMTDVRTVGHRKQWKLIIRRLAFRIFSRQTMKFMLEVTDDEIPAMNWNA